MSGILNLLLAGAASVVKDAYFNLVTLLLNTTSTNGAQNNTFLDSSTNNFSITRNGNATQGTFTPFSQTGWSNKLSSGNNLSSPSNAGYQFDSGDFTVEGWIYFNTVGNAQFLSIPVVGALYWQYFAGALDFGNNAGGSVQASWSPVANTWYHVAAVRNGGTFTNYINGAVHSSGSAFNVTATGTLQVGYGGAGSFDGYFSNVRIVKGTAVYTAAFTPPTAPLTAISGTQLLICQSNRFADSSTNALTLTVNGSPSVQAFSPFAPTTAYSTSAVGGSGYFDGSGDYLATTQSAYAPSGDFTVEGWFYTTDSSGYGGICSTAPSAGTPTGWRMTFSPSPARIGCYFNGSDFTAVNYNANTWYHLALVRSGSGSNNCSFYVNGIRVGQITNTTAVTETNMVIGRYFPDVDNYYLKGYISGCRLVVGTALYSGASFTPPTAPPTAVSGTQLLLNMTNAGIYDSTAKNDLETVGTAQVSTTQAKWGSTSMKFDGSSSSWLFIPFRPTLDLSTGSPDWTLECWAYIVSYSNSPYLFNKGGVAATYYTNYSIVIPSSGVAYLALGNNGGETGYNFGSVSTNTWYHFAATRQGNTIRTFLNGTLVTNTTIGAAMADNGEGLYIGVLKNLTTNVLNGYIDDLRITKGYARYTATFTPPTAAFPIQ